MTQDYSKYSVTDFLTNDLFVEHHLNATRETEDFWSKATQTQEYHEAVEILNSIRLGLRGYQNTKLSDETKTFIFNKIQETNQKSIFKAIHKKPVFWLGAAASVFLVISLVIFFTNTTSSYSKNLAQIHRDIIEKKNLGNKTLLIHLPDGSAVKLEPKSKISYSNQFEKDKRVVILSGAATFDIAKDPTRPFLVFANEVTTKVLGTRFFVKAYESMKKIEVSVEEGKVSVYKNKEQNKAENELTGVILLPNQQAVFDRETDQYEKKLIKTPNIINQTIALNFEFDETPIESVFKKIEIAYGIDIEFDENLLKGCQVTGTFDNESLFQKLDIITKIIGGSYEVVEGKIIINSRGC